MGNFGRGIFIFICFAILYILITEIVARLGSEETTARRFGEAGRQAAG